MQNTLPQLLLMIRVVHAVEFNVSKYSCKSWSDINQSRLRQTLYGCLTKQWRNSWVSRQTRIVQVKNQCPINLLFYVDDVHIFSRSIKWTNSIIKLSSDDLVAWNFFQSNAPVPFLSAVPSDSPKSPKMNPTTQ